MYDNGRNQISSLLGTLLGSIENELSQRSIDKGIASVLRLPRVFKFISSPARGALLQNNVICAYAYVYRIQHSVDIYCM